MKRLCSRPPKCLAHQLRRSCLSIDSSTMDRSNSVGVTYALAVRNLCYDLGLIVGNALRKVTPTEERR